MQTEKLTLPIDQYIPGILEAARNYSTVMVKASPGSGKTTRLPWALSQGLGKKVVVLEPRRLAAKLAAQRIADEENLTLGKEVGFHFRFEKNISDSTDLIFYTEGTFLKKFLQDGNLKDVDIVILDEFHERHLETDLALALLRELQKTRTDLKIILMSATLDLKLINAFPDSTVIEIDAKIFPVEINYLPNQPSILNQSLEQKVKKAIDSVLEAEGDILVFLPGMREMTRVQSALKGNYDVFLLHADLSREEQATALRISPRKKIILATNIAESSVTIPGVRTVIDSGIQREAHYSAWNGLKFIQDVPVTKSSAIQRAGRAGRTGPGLCQRLYSQQDYNERPDHTVPEIERADLTDVYLLVSGTKLKPHWFHPPPQEKWEKAGSLLRKLGALNDSYQLTETGKKMLEFPLDSRLARILIAGEKLSIKSKESLLRCVCEEIEEDRTGTLKRRLQFYLKTSGNENFPWEKCLLMGFVDQVAKLRLKNRDFIHFSGKTIKAHQSLEKLHDDFYLILDITQRQEAIKVFPIEEEWLWDLTPFPFVEEDEIQSGDKIVIKRKTKLGSIVMEELSVKIKWIELPPETKEKIIQQSSGQLKSRIEAFKESPQYERLHFWGKLHKQNTDELLALISLTDYFSEQPDLNWEHFDEFIKNALEKDLDLKNIDRELPFRINLGGRRELTVHYPIGMEPFLEAPIQDFYGLSETPMIMNGKIPLTLKLVGPHKRPMQITKDLKNFWHKTYQEMKKEYQRDYPRHYWPEKPWEAQPILLKRMLPKV
jgi:ATP-dependent helicase HrpB